MKKITVCFLLWFSYSCNNQSSTTSETKPAQMPPETNKLVTDTAALNDRWNNDPAYRDSLEKAWTQSIEKHDKERLEKESKYTPEMWADIYSYKLEDYLRIESHEVKYNANYQPSLYLTIKNWGGLPIISMEFLAGNYSGFNRNLFKVRQTVPPRATVNIIIKIPEDIASLPISVYSAIGSTGKRFLCENARKASY